jgi:hypothetical protein
VTANSGPKDLSLDANWDTGSAPGGAPGQDVWIENYSGDLTDGLDWSAIANTLDSLNIALSCTSSIGVNGATGHSGTYFKVKASKVDIGYNYGAGASVGSGRIMIDTGSVASIITIFDNAPVATDTDKPAIRLLANNAATVIHVKKGSVGVAFEAGETSTVGTINETFVNNINTDASLFIGVGVTMSALNKKGGDCILGCSVANITNEAGDMITHGTGAVLNFNVNGGTVTSNSTGTITTLSVDGTGIADFSQSSEARIVTTAKIDPGGKIIYDPGIVDMTNKIQPLSTSGTISIAAA